MSLRITAMVLEETRKQGTGKTSGQPYDMTMLRLVDAGQKPKCKTVFELDLAKEDEDQRGKLEGQILQFDLTEVNDGFKGVMRCKGLIVRQTEPAKK